MLPKTVPLCSFLLNCRRVIRLLVFLCGCFLLNVLLANNPNVTQVRVQRVGRNHDSSGQIPREKQGVTDEVRNSHLKERP